MRPSLTRYCLLIALALLCCPPNTRAAQSPALAVSQLKPSDLFQVTNVWELHLTFAAEQWEKMEPKGGPTGLFERPPGSQPARPPGGAGRAPGGGGGGAGMFGPAMLLAPTFLKEGDADKDGKLSRAEFESIGAKWFTNWNKDNSGGVAVEQLRAGLNSAVVMPGFMRPPRGARGGGMGMNLQGEEGKRNGLASAMGIEFDYVKADLEFSGFALKDVGVRYKGNGTFLQSRETIKRSLKVDLNRYAPNQRLAGLTTLNLHNCVTDSSWMNEVLSHRLFRAAGVPAPRTAYARVYVTVPGVHNRQYLGLYSMVEDVDKNFLENQFGSRKGAIFKPVTPTLFADLGNDWKAYNQTYDPKTELSSKHQERIIEFCKLVTHASDADFAAKLDEYLDLDQFARFMAVEVWIAALDSVLSIGQNYYLFMAPKTQKLQFFPWDLDHSFGQFPMMGTQEQREQLSIHRPWMGDNRFLERVFAVPAFKKLYLAKMDEFSSTIFKPDNFTKQVDEIAQAIRPAVQEESPEKLERFDKVVAGEPVTPVGFGRRFQGPGGPPGGGPRPERATSASGDSASRADGQSEPPQFAGPPGMFQPIKPIKGFVTARAKSVADQLSGRSEGQTVQFGFGPPGQRGNGGRPPGADNPGPPRDFGPGTFLADPLLAALDQDKDKKLTQEEFSKGFAKWFDAWNTDRSGVLTEEQLRTGINQDLQPRGGPPGQP